MGFFEDTKPPEVEQSTQQKQDWSAALVAGTFSLVGLILVGMGKMYWHVVKPLLTFDGKTRQQVLVQLSIFGILNGVPLYLLYCVPWVRDFTTLSTTHTINHSNGYRITFPDRSYFITEGRRRGGNFDSKVYITYAGYTEGTSQKMESGTCQMVPRGMKIRLESISPPVSAEGFTDEVKYTTLQEARTFSGFRYAWELILHPGLWFNRDKLRSLLVKVDNETSWSQFTHNWNIIQMNSGAYRSFEVEARAREHAVICF